MRVLRALFLGFLLALAGCGRAVPTPVAPGALPAAASARPPTLELPLASYDLTLDATTLQTSIALADTSRNTAASDDLYVLSLESLQARDSFRIVNCARQDEELVLTYRVAHPFPAPTDPAGLPSATNRADLGVSGQTLFLATVPFASSHTYFTDVIANTTLVSNADVYVRPRGLITGYTSFANTFPAFAFVDERGEGTRIGVSNGGRPTGNFGTNSWTRSEIGAKCTAWTGYGVLHQGQVSERQVRLRLSAFPASGVLSLRVVLLAHYVDPVGGATAAERQAHRLPEQPMNFEHFVYRMPHGTVPRPRIGIVQSGYDLVAGADSTTTLLLRLTDWHAQSLSTSYADLEDDPDPRRVTHHANGYPELALCIPGVTGSANEPIVWVPATRTDDDASFGGDAAADSGHPGDELFYVGPVPNHGGSGQIPGDYTGLLRVSDPDPPVEPLALDPATLQPLTAALPDPAHYQVISVRVGGPGSGWVTTKNASVTMTVLDMAVSSAGEVALCGDFQGLYDFGGGTRSWLPSDRDALVLVLDAAGQYRWDVVLNGSGLNQARGVAFAENDEDVIVNASIKGNVVYLGGGVSEVATASRPCLVRYTPAGIPRWVRVGNSGSLGAEGGDVVVSATGQILACGRSRDALDFGGGGTLPGGAYDGWFGSWTGNGDLLWDRRWAGSYDDECAAIAFARDGDALVGGTARRLTVDGIQRCYNGQDDALLVKYRQNGNVHRVKWWGSLENETLTDLAVDPLTGAIYACGEFNGELTFGGAYFTSGLSPDGYVVKLTPDVTYQYEYLVKGLNTQRVEGVTAIPGAGVVATGIFASTISLGGAPIAANSIDGFIVRLNDVADEQWSAILSGTQYQEPKRVLVAPTGGVRIGGIFDATTDFDPGPGVVNVSAVGGADNAFLLNLDLATGRF